MKRYAVVFEESAQADVRESYGWGWRIWGKHEAQQWVRQLRTAVSEQLAVVPKAFPLAPEVDEFSKGIRQMVVGRYRILFTIKGRNVHVLHIRGAFGGGKSGWESLNATLALSDRLRHPKEQLKRCRCRLRVNFHRVRTEQRVLSDHVPSKCVSICQTRYPR